MKIYLCFLVERRDRIDNTQFVHATLDRSEAERWKFERQKFENEIAGPWKAMDQRYVVRTGGGDYDNGPTATIVAPGTGVGTARVFEVEAKEFMPVPESLEEE